MPTDRTRMPHLTIALKIKKKKNAQIIVNYEIAKIWKIRKVCDYQTW